MRVKKLVPVLMFAIAIITSFAFRSVKLSTPDCSWFIYNGPQPATLADSRTASNYTFSATAPSCPKPGQKLCAICVNNGSNPAFPSEINTQGTSTTTDDTPQVNVTGTDIHTELGNALSGGVWTQRIDQNGTATIVDVKQ